MHCHDVPPDKSYPQHNTLRKRIFSYYKEMGAEDAVEYDKESDDYYETQAADERTHQQILDKYNDQIFWEELADRLAERDLIKEIGFKKLQSMKRFDRMIKSSEAAEEYENEFEKYGLERLIVHRDESIVS